jgi:hypothetical protein
VYERLVSETGVVDATVEGSQFRRGLVVNAPVAGTAVLLRLAGAGLSVEDAVGGL